MHTCLLCARTLYHLYLYQGCFSPRTRTFAFPVFVYLQGLESVLSWWLHKYVQQTQGLDPCLKALEIINRDGHGYLRERHILAGVSRKRMPPNNMSPLHTSAQDPVPKIGSVVQTMP